MSMSEQDPLLPAFQQQQGDPEAAGGTCARKERVAYILESRRSHQLIISLTLIDTAIVLADLSYTLLSSGCEPTGEDGPRWLEILSIISFVITCLFFIEIPLTIWCFGIQYYNPLGKLPHSKLHFFDASVIVTTIVLELVLRGKERELAGLLVILRLWRLVKVVEGIAVGAGQMQEDESTNTEQLRDEIQKLRTELASIQLENSSLRARVASLQLASPGHDA